MSADEDCAVYRDLMRFKPAELTANGWAVKAGVSRTVWADMRRHGNPSRRTLEKLLAAAGSSLAEFEALRLGQEPRPSEVSAGLLGDHKSWDWNPARLPSLPLLATSLAGEWGETGSGVELTEVRWDELVDRLPRPSSLAAVGDAYALTLVGDSMWPRFRPGRQIAVNPRSPVVIGDDVVVRLRPTASSAESPSVLIKELVKRTNGGIELRQFNPDVQFTVVLSDVEAIHKIIGELI
jgi:SOS-response transcriptional repressor LexA